MKKSISFLLTITLVFSISMVGKTSAIAAQFGDFTYTISDSAATITDYTGSGAIVTIPNFIEGFTVSTIGTNAFYGCKGLNGVNIPNSVLTIGYGAFSACSGLTKVTLPNSVNTIVGNVFSYCDNLTQINVDGSNNSYSSAEGVLFDKSKTRIIIFPNGKSGDYFVPKSVVSIDGFAFEDCKGLTSISFPFGLTSIGMGAFQNCSGLSYLTIPSTVSSINANAFFNCSNLRIVTFDGNAPTLGTGVFYACSTEFKVYYESTAKGFSNPWHGNKALMMPGPTTINTITNQDKFISGKGTTGGVAMVVIGKTLYTSNVTNGYWKVTLKNTLAAGTYISAGIILNNNVSNAEPIQVIPATPTVNALKANSALITGSATKGSMVYAKIGTKTYSAKANSKTGKFSVKSPKLKKGVSVAVYCKIGGQTSGKKIVKVF